MSLCSKKMLQRLVILVVLCRLSQSPSWNNRKKWLLRTLMYQFLNKCLLNRILLMCWEMMICLCVTICSKAMIKELLHRLSMILTKLKKLLILHKYLLKMISLQLEPHITWLLKYGGLRHMAKNLISGLLE